MGTYQGHVSSIQSSTISLDTISLSGTSQTWYRQDKVSYLLALYKYLWVITVMSRTFSKFYNKMQQKFMGQGKPDT